MKQLFSWKYIKYIILSLLGSEIYLFIEYILRFHEDFFNKNIPLNVFLELLGYSLLSFSIYGISFGILTATILSFKKNSINLNFKFVRNLIKGLGIIFILSVILFIYLGWVLPSANLEMKRLHYDLRSIKHFSNYERTDKSLFSDYYTLLPLPKLKSELDSISNNISISERTCDSILKTLPDSIANDIYYKFELAKFDIPLPPIKIENSTITNYKKPFQELKYIIHKLEQEKINKKKYSNEYSRRILYPMALLILFVFGASVGFYYNNQKTLLLIMLGLTYYSFLNESLFNSDIIDGNATDINYFTTLIVAISSITFILLAINKEKNTQPNSPS